LRLTRQLAELRASHASMERFVAEFNATVLRAEAGIRGLKNASRESGDDLEKLIEKARLLRDELHFLTESADQIAARLSDKAGAAARSNKKEERKTDESSPSSSAAERELARLLGKKG
jgi:hypothetical protein